MEVFLYNSNVCRLCGEENDNGTFLYSCDENNTNLNEVINKYLPIKVIDDGQLPRTICPGCTIQLEATVEFLTLIVNGQKVIRDLHFREKEYKKSILNPISEQDVITEKIVYEVNTTDGIYQVEHPIALQVAGLEKPKRKRGRPPKKHKSPQELAEEVVAKKTDIKSLKKIDNEEEPTGKRKRKTPTRFREAVQGKELERIFKEEGVTDGEESDKDVKPTVSSDMKAPKEPEIIGHLENSGELVVFAKGKGRGRPKGPLRPTRKECAICGMEFLCTGRYMSHVAQHGPVLYQCDECKDNFNTHLEFVNHQKEVGHTGKNIIQLNKKKAQKVQNKVDEVALDTQVVDQPSVTSPANIIASLPVDDVMTSLPDLDTQPVSTQSDVNLLMQVDSSSLEVASNANVETVVVINENSADSQEVAKESNEVVLTETSPTGKVRLKCNHCEKTFSNKQSKSLHIKAAHLGERPHACGECGARFAYPRSLALHALSHRRHRARASHGFACDLCGKVLNHPSSVVYHKEAEHAGQRYVCNKCGKSFKHKQLLQRHQLVHSQLRPYTCTTCNASFKTKANLINHQLLHSGVKKFACELCKHRFSHKTSLTLHMRWHTGQKPFACGTCGKSFSQKGNLAEHERIHTGEKPFQCSLCARRFTTSSQRRLHARRHGPHKRLVARGPRREARDPREAREARPHRCAVCSRTFAERGPLLRHVRTHARAPHANVTQVHKQMSLLTSSQPELAPPPQTMEVAELATDESQESNERVIYVTYQMSEPGSPPYHVVATPEQTSNVDEDGMVEPCELYTGPSMLVPKTKLEPLQLQDEELEQDELQLEQLVLEPREHMPVTDEEGNPLHFTMQDGTRLAITSADGKSLQVITKDGQTIPVEINGYADEEEVDNADTIVHQLNLQISIDSEVPSPQAQYFTIV